MNKLFIIVLALMLSLPVCADISVNNSVNEPAVVVNTLDDEIDLVNEQNTEFKQPLSKKKIAKKFLIAMGAVGFSSFAIFLMLSLYNRIRERYLGQVKTLDGETTLETPTTLDGAVKIFLDKTRW